MHIDEDKCDGCGLCVPSCAEGAIRIIAGKARLVAENLCDGLGACLGDCPQDAIRIEERDADEFDERAVQEHLAGLMDVAAGAATGETVAPIRSGSIARPAPGPSPAAAPAPFTGCPGSRVQHFGPASAGTTAAGAAGDEAETGGAEAATAGPVPSELRQWPVQLHLVPPTAPYFQDADVLLAADCTAFAVGDFHRALLRGRALAVACPKLDQAQERYLEKLVALIDEARINTLTVAVMEVPCCGGLVRLANEAASRAERKVPIKRILIGIRGQVLEESWL
jgi:NAD-dependent dihydropyrimidine dehydrogenase PreA subunit